MMFQEDVSLKGLSNYKIGGSARYFFAPKSIEELTYGLRQWSGPLFVLGGGTNILFPDEGIDGLILRPDLKNILKIGNQIRVGAGVLMPELLNFSAERGLSGLEWAGGLPGTVGGAIRGNAGAFGGEIKDSVVAVISLDISGSEPAIIRRTASECNFGYRTSVYKEKDHNGFGKKEIILEAILNLAPGDPAGIKESALEKIRYREERHPMEYPNIGSIFKNVDTEKAPETVLVFAKDFIKPDPFPVIPTAYLLSQAGLKGVAEGGAMFSPKHPNFIVNTGGATAADVKSLINLGKDRIKKHFGVFLEEEVIVL